MMFLLIGGGPVTVAYEGGTDASAQSWIGAPFGAESADRVIVVVFRSSRGAAPSPSLSSATIGGVSATIHVSQTDSDFPPAQITYRGIAIASAVVPTGTTGDISATYAAASGGTIHVYSVRNMLSNTATDTAAVASTTSPLSTTIDVKADGVTFVENMSIATGSGTPTGYSQAYSVNENTSAQYSEGGYVLPTADESNRAVSTTIVGTSIGHLVAASFR